MRACQVRAPLPILCWLSAALLTLACSEDDYEDGAPQGPEPTVWIGQVEDLWDEVAIARYPRRADLVRMSSSEAWREIAVHRTAGLAGQLNIETVAPPGFAKRA